MTTTAQRDNQYPGGKGLAAIWKWIVAMMPTHSTYVEPFAGKAAVMRNKPPAKSSLLIDRDPETIAWLRVLAWPGATVKRGDGIRWLDQRGKSLDEDCLIYCDPPYLHSTRKRLNLYRFELSRRDHERLLSILLDLPCRVMISGYASRLYDRRLKSWYRDTHPAITRGRTIATEVVWCNFVPGTLPPVSPVEYSALGGDYRERERVARKLRRWSARLQALPTREREALLSNLIHAHQLAAMSVE